MPIIFFTIINSFCYGILNSLEKFYHAEFSPFTRSIIIFLTIFLLGNQVGIVAVIIGYNLGEIGKFFHLFYILYVKEKIKINKKFNN